MAKIRKVGQVYKTGNNAKAGFNLTTPNFLQVGIQGVPGTIFSFNDGPDIIIGNTGIYEINFEGFGISVGKLTIKENTNYDDNDYLIIDYIYEEEEGVQ